MCLNNGMAIMIEQMHDHHSPTALFYDTDDDSNDNNERRLFQHYNLCKDKLYNRRVTSILSLPIVGCGNASILSDGLSQEIKR